MITWYNFPYYKTHFEKLGFVEKKNTLKVDFLLKCGWRNVFKSCRFNKKRYQLTPLNFTSTKEVMPYVDQMFKLFNDSYSKLQSFVAINEIQIAYFKKKIHFFYQSRVYKIHYG